jgi:hypothetical protein
LTSIVFASSVSIPVLIGGAPTTRLSSQLYQVYLNSWDAWGQKTSSKWREPGYSPITVLMRGPSPRQSYIHTEVIDRSKIQLEDHVVSKDWAISKYSTKQVLNATQLRDAFESVSIKQRGREWKYHPPPKPCFIMLLSTWKLNNFDLQENQLLESTQMCLKESISYNHNAMCKQLLLYPSVFNSTYQYVSCLFCMKYELYWPILTSAIHKIWSILYIRNRKGHHWLKKLLNMSSSNLTMDVQMQWHLQIFYLVTIHSTIPGSSAMV